MSDFALKLERLSRKYYALITERGVCSVEAQALPPQERVAYQRNFHARKGPDSVDTPADVRKMNIRAMSSCIRCPVRQPCLEYALINHEASSIWGGYKDNLRALLISVGTGTPTDYAPAEWTEENWSEVLRLFKHADEQESIPYRQDAPSKKVENLYAKLTVTKKQSA